MSEAQTATTNTSTGVVTSTMGDAANTSQINSSAAASVPSMPAQQAPANDMKTLLGEYAEDPMFKDFKDFKDIAKSYKETKSLVGQKLGIPSADATPEAKAAFYKALGVPESAEGYQLPIPDKLPENMKEYYTGEFLKNFTAKAKELGLTSAQARGLQEWNDKEMFDILNSVNTDAAKADAEFDKVATKYFGEHKMEALQSARALIEEHVPAEFRASMGSLPDEALAIITSVANGLAKKMTGKEDSIIGKSGSPVGGMTEAQIREKARALQSQPEFASPFVKGKDAHEQIQKEVKDLYAQLGKK